MPCHDRNGRTAIFSVWGGGEGVYRERGCYFRTFHSSSINSEVGPMDPKLYFCNYFGAAFSFNVHGRLEQAALPLSATRQSPGEAGTGCWGWGRRGGRAGWGRWVPIDKETKVSPFGQMVAQVGVGRARYLLPGFYVKGWLRSGLCGTPLVSTTGPQHPGRFGCVRLHFSEAGKREWEGRDNQSALKHLAWGLD